MVPRTSFPAARPGWLSAPFFGGGDADVICAGRQARSPARPITGLGPARPEMARAGGTAGPGGAARPGLAR